ncbi:MAG: AraC family transcriptional regulator, partial [Verrucomicrobiota bacterium]
NDRRVSAGDLIVVFPDRGHQYGPEPGDIWDEVFLSFDGAAFEGWRALGLDPAHPVWRLEGGEDWSKRFFHILKMPVTSRPEACAAANAIHLLIADALAARPSASSSLDWLESTCQALSGGMGAPSLQEIARNAGLGYETFRKTFRMATGESPARYRRHMRLAQAALMMQRADLSLEMIATALDFCDAFHLSKAFKLQYGISPAEHRRKGANPS